MTERLEAPPECYAKGKKGDWKVGSTRKLYEGVRKVTERLEAPPECYEKGDWILKHHQNVMRRVRRVTERLEAPESYTKV